MKAPAQPGDIVAGLVLLSLAAVIVQQSTTWPAAADVAGNPTVMPRVLAAIMALVGIVLIVARRVLPPQEEGGLPRPVHTIIAVVITAAFALLLEPIGLVVAGTLYLAALQRLLGASWRLVLPF